MKVFALYQAPLRKADPDETLADAADRMAFYEVGALAVFEHGKMTGIISERDVIRALSLGEGASTTPVRAYMTPGPAGIPLGAPASEAAKLMVALGTRHLPVLDGDEVVGMISARDLLAASTVREPAPQRTSV